MSRYYSSVTYQWVGDKLVLVGLMPHNYDGPIARCKGDETAKSAEKQQLAFNTQLMGVFQQQFGKQSAIMDYITAKMKPQIDNPQGYSADALAAMRTSATDQLSQQYQAAQRGLQAKEFSQGGRDLPSGVNAQLDSSLFSGEAIDKANAQNNITLQNENLKQQNYWNALNVLGGNAAQYNPQSYASGATSAANSVAGLSQAYSTSQESGFWNHLGNSFASSLGNTLGGANAKGGSGVGGFFGVCWVAAAMYGGFGDPRTQMVRSYLLGIEPTWYGRPLLALYRKHGEWASRQPILVKLLKPLFDLALRKAGETR